MFLEINSVRRGERREVRGIRMRESGIRFLMELVNDKMFYLEDIFKVIKF